MGSDDPCETRTCTCSQHSMRFRPRSRHRSPSAQSLVQRKGRCHTVCVSQRLEVGIAAIRKWHWDMATATVRDTINSTMTLARTVYICCSGVSRVVFLCYTCDTCSTSMLLVEVTPNSCCCCTHADTSWSHAKHTRAGCACMPHECQCLTRFLCTRCPR